MGITKQGLAAIAVLVAVLWGCFIAERMIMQQACREMSRALKRPGKAPARRPGGLPHPEEVNSRAMIRSSILPSEAG